MSDEGNMATAGGMAGSLASVNVTPTMTERLKREQDTLRSRLAEVESALATIEAHPEVQQAIDALAKLQLWMDIF